LVQLLLSDDLKSTIDRQIAAGLAASEAEYLQEAVRRYAEDLDDGKDLWTIAQEGIEDIEAGRFVLIETEADVEALHESTMAGVRANLAAEKI
jgi:Arc/MetJ-type ribon-helix-helix transcriptional regulator